MRRHTESDYFLFLIVLVELVAAVALIAVNNKQTVYTNSLVLCIRVKVL